MRRCGRRDGLSCRIGWQPALDSHRRAAAADARTTLARRQRRSVARRRPVRPTRDRRPAAADRAGRARRRQGPERRGIAGLPRAPVPAGRAASRGSGAVARARAARISRSGVPASSRRAAPASRAYRSRARQPAQQQPADREHHQDDGQHRRERADGVLRRLAGTGDRPAGVRQGAERRGQLVAHHRHALRGVGRGVHVAGDGPAEVLHRPTRLGEHQDGARAPHARRAPRRRPRRACPGRRRPDAVRTAGCWA